MPIESEPRNPRLLWRKRRRGKMFGSSKRDFDVGCRFHGVMATPIENVFDSPLHCQRTGWERKGENVPRWWRSAVGGGSFKRRIGHSIELLSGAMLAPLGCHLIGRVVACVEHIGKEIRKKVENNVVSTSAIVSRYFIKKVETVINFLLNRMQILSKMPLLRDNLRKNKNSILVLFGANKSKPF